MNQSLVRPCIRVVLERPCFCLSFEGSNDLVFEMKRNVLSTANGIKLLQNAGLVCSAVKVRDVGV
jgi:hypothetical protein